ncbi:unnamed protein product, partial [Mesorhabditis spiculigera]
MDMQRLIHGICYFDSIAAYFTNSMLIYMIINHSPERLGAYKYLMLSFSSCMLIFPTCHGLLMPHLFINGKSYVFFSEGFLSSWPWAAHAGIVCWGFLFGCVITVVVMQFLYRYLAVIRAAAASDPYPELALLDAENRILVQTLTDQMVNGEPALKELAEEDEDYLLYKEEIAQEESLKSHPPEEFFFEDNEI